MADEKKSESSKSESSTATSDSVPANYSRGENQKNVSQNYRDNWNLIFANSAKKTVAKSKAKAKAKPAKKSAAKKKR
jgi:hypothetical protein